VRWVCVLYCALLRFGLVLLRVLHFAGIFMLVCDDLVCVLRVFLLFDL